MKSGARKEIYVVTKYYNNGEGWGDKFNSEEPIIAFFNESDAIEFASSNASEKELPQYANYFKRFTKHIRMERFECPIGKEWRTCEEDYDEEICDECWSTNHAAEYDNSYVEYRVYKIERG